jgi:CO/xanthine dehydrogenase Mo-binding subunit
MAAKPVGEAGSVGPPPAVVNSIVNAMIAQGLPKHGSLRVTSLFGTFPATPSTQIQAFPAAIGWPDGPH